VLRSRLVKSVRGLLVAGCLAAATAGAHATERIEGTALRLPERTPVYREVHLRDALHHRVDYHSASGELIAELVLDYRCDAIAPDFLQRDTRTGQQFGARWEDGRYLLLRNQDSRYITPTESLVASSGFDRFVSANWSRLLADNVLEFEFAIPANLRTLRMRILRSTGGTQGQTSAQVHSWFRVEPALPLLRGFVDPIELGYDAEGRLLVYRGRSNLVDANGATLDVEIHYLHSAALAVDRSSATEPLALASRTRAEPHCRSRDT
jgi:hypothetical protein